MEQQWEKGLWEMYTPKGPFLTNMRSEKQRKGLFYKAVIVTYRVQEGMEKQSCGKK